MVGKIKYVLVIMMAVIVTDLSAQNSQVMYFMNLPQNHLNNPALRPPDSVYIGLPVISGVSVRVNNNFVNYSDIFINGQPHDSIISILHPGYNIDEFLSKVKDKNFIETGNMVQLLGGGFSVGKDTYVFIDINERAESNVVIPGDLIKLAFKGNEQFAGSTIDLSTLRGDMRYYREIGAGFSRNITDKLRVGIKGKILFGIASFSIKNNSLGITVNDDYSHTLNADLAVNISGPVNVYMDSNHKVDSVVLDDSGFKTRSGLFDFFSGRKNHGLGLDIGATYDLNDRIVLSASVTDLGYIRWKKDVSNLRVKNQFDFSGLNLLDVVNGTKTINEVGQDMLDSLKNAFVVSGTNEPFTTFLPFGITIGGSYNITRNISFGLISYTKIISNQVREAVTFSANVNLGNIFSTSVCYTAENNRYDNLGAGFACRAGLLQFYLLSDRIPLNWNRIKDNSGNFVFPSNLNTVNIRLGMNMVFGETKKEKHDKPMVFVE